MLLPSYSQKPSDRIRVKRFHERARYDAATIHSILDAGIICHVAFEFEGAPAVIPTLYWRDGDWLYIHGSTASRLMQAVDGRRICVAVTLLDGLILARSAFHHSANYRSVIIYGKASAIESPEDKERQFERMMEKFFPGRWPNLRPLRPHELKATRVLSVPLTETSAKVREGPPDEDETDWTWPVWAGVIPTKLTAQPGVPDGRNSENEQAPKIAVLTKEVGT